MRPGPIATSIAACFAACATAWAAPFAGIPCAYEVVILDGPDIGGFDTNLKLSDMNDAGVAVGTVSIFDPLPCVWTEGDGVKFIPVPAGVSQVEPVAINNNGWIIANAAKAGAGDRGYVLVPARGNWAWIELKPTSGEGYTRLSAISESNVVVGKQKQKVGGSWEPYWKGLRWSPGQPTLVELIEAPGWDTTELADVNDAGVICGTVCQGSAPAAEGSPSSRGIVVVGSRFTTIEPVAPFQRSSARAVNGLGVVVGNMFQLVPSGPPPMLGYSHSIASGASTVIPPPTGTVRWWAVDINDFGLVVGNSLKDWTTVNGKPCVSDGVVCVGVADLLPPPPPTAGIGVVYSVSSGGVLIADCVGMCARLYLPTWSVPGDLDCDGAVGPADLASLLAAWGQSGAPTFRPDLDGDGAVTGADLGLLLQGWPE